MIRYIAALLLISSLCFGADQAGAPSLTIYNESFAVVRQDLPMDLKAGTNEVAVTDVTMHLEPDSVILRDPTGKRPIRVLEQNYRADPISEPMLLSLFEGKTIDFMIYPQQTVKGKIIRSGYTPHNPMAMRRYGSQYYQQQMAYARSGPQQPIIEVNGQLRFGLPGTPIFPSLADGAILKPTLNWLLSTDRTGPVIAELSYVSGGLAWQADYNVVAPESGDMVDIVGWVTMDNQSGKTFENARIKLMAGDVNKIQPAQYYADGLVSNARSVMMLSSLPVVTEKAFDEYHLYTLARTTTLHDRETKQVEFIQASSVPAKRVYVYDGVSIDRSRYNGWNWENIRNEQSYGTESNPKVWVMREFMNSEANHLGIPLPKGRVRFYRRNDDGQVEFTGENMIDHTPRDEKVSLYTGNAFDLAGERRRTNYVVDNSKRTLDESFEIKVRNHKKEAVNVRVVEHLYRWMTWSIPENSDRYNKKDSQTVEFPITVAPNAEKTITYTAHYAW